MKIATTLLALLCSLCITAAAQTPDGYIVRLQGDTVAAQINYKKSGNHPANIQATINGTVSQFSPADIAGFGMMPGLHYRSRTVTYHTNPIEYTRAPAVFSDETKAGTFFLELVEDGAVALYELQLPDRHYYFIEELGMAPVELLYRVRNTKAETVEDGTYKTQINVLLEKYGLLQQLSRKTQNITYDDYSFAQLIRAINQQRSGTVYTRRKKRQIDFSVVAGANQVRFPQTFTGAFFRPAFTYKFPNQVQPVAGLQLQYRFPGAQQRYALALQLLYTQFTARQLQSDSSQQDASTYNTRTEEYYMKNQMVVLSLAPVIALNTRGAARVYFKPGGSLAITVNNAALGAGAVLRQIRYDNGEVVRLTGQSVNLAFRNIRPHFQLGAGVRWNRFFAEANWLSAARLMKEPADVQFQSGFFMATLGYRLSK